MAGPRNTTLSLWWLTLLVPLMVVVIIANALVAMALHLAVWLCWCRHGGKALFVYSDSPLWRSYIETHILPEIAGRAVVMNWSERKKWRMSLAWAVFLHFGGSREFNPLGVVFHPGRRAKVFRFWRPFHDFTHGCDAPLKKIESDFFQALDDNA